MPQPTDKEILQQFGSRLITEWKENLRSTASALDTFLVDEDHQSTDSLKEFTTNSELVITGYQYINIAERGRNKTVNPGDGALRRAVLRWIKKYSTRAVRDKKTGKPFSQETLAYFISQSIHQRGTSLFRKGGDSGVFSNALTLQRVEALRQVFGTKYFNQVKSDVVSALQDASKP